VSCVPNVASFSGLSFFIIPSVFSNMYLSCVLCILCCQFLVRVCKLYDAILYILDWTEELLSILFELCRSYICKLTLYGYILADYFI
jgi:hypothetical protein